MTRRTFRGLRPLKIMENIYNPKHGTLVHSLFFRDLSPSQRKCPVVLIENLISIIVISKNENYSYKSSEFGVGFFSSFH